MTFPFDGSCWHITRLLFESLSFSLSRSVRPALVLALLRRLHSYLALLATLAKQLLERNVLAAPSRTVVQPVLIRLPVLRTRSSCCMLQLERRCRCLLLLL